MNIKINGKNIEITKQMQAYAEKRFKYFNKFLPDDTTISISASKRGVNTKLEVYFPYKRKDVKARVEESNFNVAIDKLMDNLKNQISRLHRETTNKDRTSFKTQQRKLNNEESEIMSDEEDDE